MAEGPYIGRQAAQSITGGAYGENTELTQLQTAPGVPLAATDLVSSPKSLITAIEPAPPFGYNL